MNWTPLQVTNSDVSNQLEPLDASLKESFNNLGFKTSLDSMNAKESRPDRTPSEDDVKALGFVLDHAYPHDEWQTAVYVKGYVTAEFTYLGYKLEAFEVYIEDSAHARKCTLSQLRVISEVWG